MVEDRAIVLGDFANWRPVVGRKVLQLTIEVPIEQTRDVLERLGQPLPGQSLWVAIALIDPKKLDLKAAQATRSGAAPTNPPEKLQRKWEEIPLSQQAAIRCGEMQFQSFLEVKSDNAAGDKVREMCGVTSRADIRQGSSAGAMWLTVEEQYQLYRNDLIYGQSRHG